MRALTLRRTGFVATLLTGFALTGAAVHGMADVDSSLQLAAAPAPQRSVLVSEQHGPSWGDCKPAHRPDHTRLRT
jgi:hypothetical protein